MPLPGRISDPQDTLQDLNRVAVSGPTASQQASDILLSGGPTGGLTTQAFNSARHALTPDTSAILSPEAANAQFGIAGHLDFTKPVSAYEAQWKRDNKRDELYRSDILSRADGVNGAQRFAYGLAGGLIDPISLGINFIPFAGEGRDLQVAGLAARLGRGAWVGGAAGAVQAGAEYGLGQYQGTDYTPQDAGMAILSSAVFGAGFETVGYALSGGARAGRAGANAIETGLTDRGMTPEQARGIAGGMTAESHAYPNAINPKSGAYGIGQWLGVRKAELFRRYGEHPTLDQQMDFLAWELNGGDGGGAAVMAPGQNAGQVAHAYITQFMRPAAGAETDGDIARAAAYLGGEVSPAGHTPVGPDLSAPVPAHVSAIDEIDRAGAVTKAVSDMAEGDRVDVGDMVAQAAENPRARPELTETDAALQIPGRTFHDDMAVTTRGTEIPVRYAVVEASDLIPSHDGDLIRNPDYPEEMQPRDRDRAGSQARLLRMEAEFNPRRLINSPEAESGAPIVSPDGVVESGNGRVIVLSRNAAKETGLYASYTNALNAAGFDTTGFTHPVLVRVRTEAMDGPTRVKLSREMNADTAERYSATEQAFVDAGALSDDDVQMYQGGQLTGKANDAFLRTFLGKAGAGQENALVDPATRRLSQTGIDRIQAATVAKAYGDKSLVAAIFETSNPQIKAFGQALTEAAPTWAKMRALAQSGELATGADTTGYLVEAMNFVRHVRDNRLNLGEILDKWRDQADMFAGDALSPEAQEYLGLFFRDSEFKVQRAADVIAADLKDIAEAAIRTTPEPNLFGEVDSFDVGAQIDRLKTRAANEESFDVTDQPGAGDGTSGTGSRLSGDSGTAAGSDLPGLISLARPVEREAAGPTGGADQPAGGERLAFDPDAEDLSRPARDFPEELWSDAKAVEIQRARIAAYDISRKAAMGSPEREAALEADAEATTQLYKRMDQLRAARREQKSAPKFVFDDPDIVALQDELKRLEATLPTFGDTLPANENPDLIQEAIRAAEFCMTNGGLK